MNDLEKLNAETIKDIREKWPKHFPNEHKPVIDGIVISINLRDPTGNFIIKDITIMEPNGTEWNIAMCGDEIIDYGITMPGPDIMEGPMGLFAYDNDGYMRHVDQLSPGPKLSKPEPEPKKVIHRRIILD